MARQRGGEPRGRTGAARRRTPAAPEGARPARRPEAVRPPVRARHHRGAGAIKVLAARECIDSWEETDGERSLHFHKCEDGLRWQPCSGETESTTTMTLGNPYNAPAPVAEADGRTVDKYVVSFSDDEDEATATRGQWKRPAGQRRRRPGGRPRARMGAEGARREHDAMALRGRGEHRGDRSRGRRRYGAAAVPEPGGDAPKRRDRERAETRSRSAQKHAEGRNLKEVDRTSRSIRPNARTTRSRAVKSRTRGNQPEKGCRERKTSTGWAPQHASTRFTSRSCSTRCYRRRDRRNTARKPNR